ncbi:Nonribosomal peptide synthetase 14 [Diaporthe amygdali]|uniref:Nonribosomal peptide synthetase 14 n=1 Tax=Phomopsis amygdali TaxID=1214568 RepID=UPI0022FE6345|nr:Nonribosomal peptide synthetase 14 [Diaporthe amygdali]KAJ0120669.1 Nonribosomal peptide synthetase 14 [Diaporthe amygdali]
MAYVQATSEPIAIIGSGCRYPGTANTPSKLWSLLKEPYDLSKKAPTSRYNVDGFYHENGEHHGTTNAPNAYWFQEDPRLFDASFFSITPKECEAIDPQGKVLLEVVYEAMESAGLTIQSCTGKKVGVFVGTMTADYDSLCAKDEVTASQYSATGTSRAIISNRVSYFFNWNGPSMTIDTACSSSLVAMHQAVQSLRIGESTIACVAGANIMLAPEAFIIEASLHMLSPEGKSKMWDASANGYARGEGVGVFFLKTLSQALADGDQIECVIRETGVNSDGRSKGITMPSPEAQAALIKDTYNRSGLDPRDPLHRCQYFEAHGTGTQAGDPREAEAIHTAFFGSPPGSESETMHMSPSAQEQQQLTVGSIKTVIGHTEGAAGVAGVLKAMLGLKNRLIPPNQHLVTLNPSVAPFSARLKVPVALTPWPKAPPGQPLRASVNSFGFGGTNAHAILERYEPGIHGRNIFSEQPSTQRRLENKHNSSLGLPFLICANTEHALVKRVEDYLEYIRANPDIDLVDLACTLALGRSTLPHKVAFPASSREGLLLAMEAKLETVKSKSGAELSVRTKDARRHKILGVFTGQGAQWATMGKELMDSSPVFRDSLLNLDQVLKSCADPPSWSLIDELAAPAQESRLGQAALSQPLCTAVQVGLVDLLNASGVRLSAVVGHSSGEIGAAYASGAVDAREAILLAYYRGFHAKLAGGAGADSCKGGMMAAGMGVEDALNLCSDDDLVGKVYVAASNAPASVTLSGDLDAIQRAKERLDETKKFNRLLQVDTAYHSHHMDRCAAPYLESLAACNIRGRMPSKSCSWVSSVYGPAGSPTTKELAGRYWRDNMVQPVLFTEALTRALAEHGPFDAALEIGPHPALKGPATQTMQDVIGKVIPYVGVLSRGKSDLSALSEALGMLWCTLGTTAVDLNGYAAALGLPVSPGSYSIIKDLPPYPWDHSVMHYREPRVMRQYVQRPSAPHELLGVRTLDDSESGFRWRNILQPVMLPWLVHHRFQGQIIVPAAAYCVMALDAARALAVDMDADVSMFEVRDLVITSAITMPDDSQGVETLFSLQRDTRHKQAGSVVAHFILDWNPVDGSRPAKHAVSGTIVIHLGTPSEGALPSRSTQAIRHQDLLTNVDVDEFYDAVKEIGLGYTGPFRSVQALQRRMNFATAQLQKPHPEDTSVLPVRPALLDSSFQAAFAAFSAPGDGALWTSFLPQTIDRLCFNPVLCDVAPVTEDDDRETRIVDVEANITRFTPTSHNAQASFSVDIDISNSRGCIEIQIEGLVVSSFANTTAEHDREMYLQTIYKPDPWDHFSVSFLDAGVTMDAELAELCSRVSLAADADKEEEGAMNQLIASNPYRQHLELLRALGGSFPSLVPGLIQEILQDSLDMSLLHRRLTHVVDQISHRFPAIAVLEINLGGSATSLTQSIWAGLAAAASSYTYAHPEHVSPPSLTQGLSNGPQPHKFRAVLHANDKSFSEQDYAMNTYDLIIVSQGIGEDVVRDMRQLVRSGGFLITVQAQGQFLREKILHSLNNTAKTNNVMIQNEMLPAKLSPQTSRDCGFGPSLHEYTTPRAGMSLVVSQAVSEETDFLRSPLDNVSLSGVQGTVLIVGGKRPETECIRDRLQGLLATSECNVTSARSLEEASAEDLRGLRAAVILADLDEPVLQTMTDSKLAALQVLFSPGRYVLWLTSGSRADQPYHTASVGMLRTVKGETPKMQLQFLDVDTLAGIEDAVAAAFLRLAFTFEQGPPDTLWTVESELFLERGRTFIPRLLPIQDSNDRLNSTRRVINRKVNTEKTVVDLIVEKEAGELVYSARNRGRPEDLVAVDLGAEDTVVVRMLYTSAWAVSFDEETFLFVGVGITPAGRKVIVTSPRSSSWMSVSAAWLHEIQPSLAVNEDRLVPLLVRTLLARRLMSLSQPGPTATHEADGSFASLLECAQRGQEHEHPIYHTTIDQKKAASDERFILIHPRSTLRRLQDTLPTEAGTLVDFTLGPTSASSLAAKLSHRSLLAPKGSLVQLMGQVDTRSEAEHCVAEAISDAQDLLTKAAAHLHETAPAVTVHRVVGQGTQPYFGAVDWITDAQRPLVQRIRQIEASTILSPSKTYLLVGLTGDLGQSLSRFMVENGARYIVVASRNPGTAKNWAADVQAMGATIRLEALDVTDLSAVRRMKENLASVLPPIGGVINGAMILADGLFADMTVENLQKVLQPKVAGSHNLDVAFSDPEPDFFIMFSSLTAIGGNSGQSNYTGANLYMAGLAAQRRKRGLAASVLDIGMLVGIGYINRVEGSEIYKNLRRQGYRPISEHDIHHMFVEAVVAGRVGSGSVSSQLSTGLQRFNPHGDNELPWHSDPRLSHHTIDANGELAASSGSGDALQSVRGLIQDSQTQEQISAALQEAFAAQLESMLRLPGGSINKDAPIIDLGVDSLVAVEIRAWFLKEVEKDVPVLKILGGDSVATVCEETAKEIMEERTALEEQAEASDAGIGSVDDTISSSDINTGGSSLFDSPHAVPTASGNNQPDATYDQISLMSYSQARMWFPFLLLEDKTTYNCTTSYRLRGPLDVQRYEDAIHSVIQKHQVLRTCFYTDLSTGEPTQAVCFTSPFQLKKVDEAEDDGDVAIETQLIAGHIYDLENAGTLIATLLSHDSEYHTIIFGYHHIILDGVSWQQFLQEVEHFYIKPTTKPALPAADYIDFAVKQRAELNLPALQKKRAFWRDTFSQLPSTIPLFPFAMVKTRRSLQHYEAKEFQLELDPALVQRIKAVSTEHQGTSFHFYVAALQVMMHRLLGIDNVCIGITDANRSDPAFMKTIGLLLDSLPLWFHLDENETFRDRFQHTRTAIYSALGNSGVPLDVILEDVGVENSVSHMPLFQVLVNYRMGALAQETVGDDIQLEYLAYTDARHPFDFILTIDEKGGRGGLTLSMQNYLYDQAAADVFIATYIHFLETFSNLPLANITEPARYSETLTKHAVQLGAGSHLSVPMGPRTLPARIEQMANHFKNDIAITDASGSFTYHEMELRVDEIAIALEGKGVTDGTRVGLFGQLSANTVFSLLAILRVGAVYVPLDERNSDERLAAIVAESGARVIIHDQETASRVPTLVAGALTTVELLDSSSTVRPQDEEVKTTKTTDKSSPSKLAFIMFTSGSTGKPKGIMLTHRNMLAHVTAATATMGLRRETVLQQSALGYDASLAQIFYALANGGRLVISSNRGEMGTMAHLMRKEAVTLTLMSPSEYTMLMQYGSDDLSQCESWKVAMCGGEAFPPRLRIGFRALSLERLGVWNAYGPTEISVASNIGLVDYRDPSLDSEPSVAIGKALPGYNLAVQGPAVSLGYLGQPALTAQKFRPAAAISMPSVGVPVATDIWYTTGDMARMAADGSLLYLGRVDQDSQIKLRGIRIELDEVANSILDTAGGILSQAVVVVRGEDQAQFLVAYVVFSTKKEPVTVEQYLERLLTQLPLPLYMRPAQAIALKALPTNASGKLDRRALQDLPLPTRASQQSEDSDELTPTERRLRQIWETVLERDDAKITRSSNFFSAGGNSLLLLRLQAEISKAFHVRIPLPELFRMSTLQSLADFVQQSAGGHALKAPGVADGANSSNSNNNNLDWVAETAVPQSILELGRTVNTNRSVSRARPSRRGGLVVILTGATGFLGRHIVRELQSRPEVIQIVCIAVRNPFSDAARAIERDCPKAVLYAGDLRSPRLGLAEDEARLLFADADAIIHNGADVSFLKPYATLRAPNLGSTQELVRLRLRMTAPGRHVPLHFVSTAGVGILSGKKHVDAVSLAASSPSGTPVDGYVASKWASEVFLERAAEGLSIPVRIYRPSSITGDGAPTLDIMHNVVTFSRRLRAVPEMRGWRGWFDFVAVESVARGLVHGVIGEHVSDSTAAKDVGFVHLSGELVIPIDEAKTQMQHETGYEFRSLDLTAWVREAVGVGLHPLVAAYLESTLEAETDELWFPKLHSDLTSLDVDRKAKDGAR